MEDSLEYNPTRPSQMSLPQQEFLNYLKSIIESEKELEEAAPVLRTWGAEAVATPEELGDGPDGARPMVVIIRRTPQVRV